MNKKLFFIITFLFGIILVSTFFLLQTSLLSKKPSNKDLPMIVVDYPKPNDIVKSPLLVRGKARGGWYFEGDFPLTLYYGVKDEWVESYATAKGEWMTEEYVEFEGTLVFPTPYANEGTLVLHKDNPSDIKELNDQLIIPVRFK